MFDVTFMSGNN
jgi:hypothetical protein